MNAIVKGSHIKYFGRLTWIHGIYVGENDVSVGEVIYYNPETGRIYKETTQKFSNWSCNNITEKSPENDRIQNKIVKVAYAMLKQKDCIFTNSLEFVKYCYDIELEDLINDLDDLDDLDIQKGEDMTHKDTIDLLIHLEKQRADELIRIEKARLDMQLEYEQKRIELLSTNKESYTWLEELRSDLRKELISFNKKAIPDIHAALSDGKVPENLVNMWLEEISKLYLNDINLALRMVAVDIDELNQNLFKEIVESYENRFKDILENLLKKFEASVKADTEAKTA